MQVDQLYVRENCMAITDWPEDERDDARRQIAELADQLTIAQAEREAQTERAAGNVFRGQKLVPYLASCG